ncbi:hypothetical protein [Flavivirga aquatica]|uniref:hypothetical protein n=1 Tax=Flavivirga aquatica TaxID=1849968 RepID=UPI0013F4CEB5|nr:hypothetical protein [Flavivirga aquatica]
MILILLFVYALYRYEWNNYAIGKSYKIQGISGVVETSSTIILTTINPYLFISKDSGKTWSIKMFNLKEDEDKFSNLEKNKETISFISRKNSGGDTSPQFLYVSKNEGRSWDKKNINELLLFNDNISSEDLSIDHGIIECLDMESMTYYYSKDYGENWQESSKTLIRNNSVEALGINIEKKNNAYLVKRKDTVTEKAITIFSINTGFKIGIFGDVTFLPSNK